MAQMETSPENGQYKQLDPGINSSQAHDLESLDFLEDDEAPGGDHHDHDLDSSWGPVKLLKDAAEMVQRNFSAFGDALSYSGGMDFTESLGRLGSRTSQYFFPGLHGSTSGTEGGGGVIIGSKVNKGHDQDGGVQLSPSTLSTMTRGESNSSIFPKSILKRGHRGGDGGGGSDGPRVMTLPETDDETDQEDEHEPHGSRSRSRPKTPTTEAPRVSIREPSRARPHKFIPCRFAHAGCKELLVKGELSEVDHYQNCQFRPVRCLMCDICPDIIPHHDLIFHLQSVHSIIPVSTHKLTTSIFLWQYQLSEPAVRWSPKWLKVNGQNFFLMVSRKEGVGFMIWVWLHGGIEEAKDYKVRLDLYKGIRRAGNTFGVHSIRVSEKEILASKNCLLISDRTVKEMSRIKDALITDLSIHVEVICLKAPTGGCALHEHCNSRTKTNLNLNFRPQTAAAAASSSMSYGGDRDNHDHSHHRSAHQMIQISGVNADLSVHSSPSNLSNGSAFTRLGSTHSSATTLTQEEPKTTALPPSTTTASSQTTIGGSEYGDDDEDESGQGQGQGRRDPAVEGALAELEKIKESLEFIEDGVDRVVEEFFNGPYGPSNTKLNNDHDLHHHHHHYPHRQHDLDPHPHLRPPSTGHGTYHEADDDDNDTLFRVSSSATTLDLDEEFKEH